MKILFVTNNFTPYSSGIVSSIMATVTELRNEGHDVTVVAPQFLPSHDDDPEWVVRVPSLFRFRYKKNYMALMWRSKNFLRKLFEQEKPDIVHIHHPFLLGARAAAVAKKMGIKTIFTYHTLYEAYAHYFPLPDFLMQRLITDKVNALCRRVDEVVVPSSEIQTYLHAQGIEHSTIIPSGLKEQYLNLPFHSKKSEAPYRLLYVGRLVKEKNIPALFDMLAQLPHEYTLTLAGYGDYVKELQKYAFETKRIPHDRVSFIIEPDQDTIKKLYETAHLFLFPSHTDTQGLVIAEAMAGSTPVVALDGPGQRDIIRTEENGYIVADPSLMAEVVQRILTDEKQYAALQKNAWESAQAYDPRQLVSRLVAIYER